MSIGAVGCSHLRQRETPSGCLFVFQREACQPAQQGPAAADARAEGGGEVGGANGGCRRGKRLRQQTQKPTKQRAPGGSSVRAPGREQAAPEAGAPAPDDLKRKKSGAGAPENRKREQKSVREHVLPSGSRCSRKSGASVHFCVSCLVFTDAFSRRIRREVRGLSVETS